MSAKARNKVGIMSAEALLFGNKENRMNGTK